MGGVSMYITALVMGLAGSLHCLGMCGPIFMAASGFYDKPGRYAWSLILHHGGKILSYAALGLLTGLIGQGASLLWFQNKVMVFCGILLLLMGIGAMVRWQALGRLNNFITGIMGRVLKKSVAGSFVLGVVNGLVPCGLVYAAAVGAAATQNSFDGLMFMVLFGVGTIPALSFAGLSRWLIPMKRVKNLGIWKQIPVVILGFWLLLKGLGLGIPLISPDLGSHEPEKNCCERHVHPGR